MHHEKNCYLFKVMLLHELFNLGIRRPALGIHFITADVHVQIGESKRDLRVKHLQKIIGALFCRVKRP